MEEIDTKDRIKEVAHSMVMQYAIRSVSMDDIAASLGMSKKTIYQYYKDKDALVDAVVSDVISKNQCTCCHDRDQARDAIHEIFLALDMIADMYKAMNPSVLFDLQKYHPGSFSKFLKHKNDFMFNAVFQNLIRGIEEELYRPEINKEILARYRVDSVLLPLNPDFLRQIKASLSDVHEELLLHYLYGLVTPKGYKLTAKYLEKRKLKSSQ